jgi:glyoxylase-like metal-dependent hydrolase (beta-lactamase superfamily II)
VITFEHDVTVHLNGEDIRALHFPSVHTDGDSIIFLPKNNVVHRGTISCATASHILMCSAEAACKE